MTSLRPSMRLKVKADTFFLPDPNGGAVYFQNNEGSFRMEGRSIHQWIEKLLPVFDGQHSLQDLTDGLPGPYRDRVYEIAELLYRNGFVRDVSTDLPHQLPDAVIQRYASQIEFLDNLGGSGAHRFQRYREAKALAVGSGPFLLSLIAALLGSGLKMVHVLITDSTSTNRQRIEDLTIHFQTADPDVAVVEIEPPQAGAWREVVRPFDAVFYATESLDVPKLLALQAACRAENSLFIPATVVEQTGMAGPLVRPDSAVTFESVLRRIHESAVRKEPEFHPFSPTAAAMLTNVAVFEWFKAVTGVTESDAEQSFYFLNLETFEGNWHSCLPHPLVVGHASPRWVEELNPHEQPAEEDGAEDRLLSFFDQLTSREAGIFHQWEEGDLPQFPLPLCRVQPVDPLAHGPASLLQEVVCAGITHAEARRDAGLAGIEAYVARLAQKLVPSTLVQPQEFLGVGAGVTVAEGVCRGLSKWLAEAFRKQISDTSPQVVPVKLAAVEDDHCRFYLEALATMQGSLTIGLGEEVLGFPVVWVGANGRWYGNVGLNETLALKSALQHALAEQNRAAGLATGAIELSSVHITTNPAKSLKIPACEDASLPTVLQSAFEVLQRYHKRVNILDLSLEPFLSKPLAGVFGVLLREEEAR